MQVTWDEHALLYILAYPTSTATSVVAYRISPFHPLAGYPGPVLARVSKFWAVWNTWRGRQHHVITELHRRYGTFVRIGPNDLSVVDVKAVTQVLGANGLAKGEWYSARKDPKAPNNLFILTGEEHANRRRLWNRGMSNESLKDYEPVIAKRSDELVQFLKTSASSGSVDLNNAVGYFTFDFMGDMAFGASFHLLISGDTTGLWDTLERFSITIALLTHIPWAHAVARKLPLISGNLRRLRNFAFSAAMGRVKAGASKKDLWYHLSDEAGMESKQPPVSDVAADAVLAIIAGSDTTASALSAFFYFILRDNTCYGRLQKEIDAVYPPGTDATESSAHDQLVFLDACLNETLRLLPPGPTNGPRQVPYGSAGTIVAGRYVPPGTQIYVPPCVLHRDPRYFSPAPEAFIPTRWIPSEAGLSNVLDRTAFIPFSYGPANCAGRNLARLELKMAIIALMRKLNLTFAEGFAAQEWPDTIEDYLVTFRGPLLVDVSERAVTG
ncbi:cytochrome P450 [Lentinus brumalis]|uniref:Cytochrome P450 n=1 Tax=Lentinus brumalis TaxID=2498619 RepID=A0A371CUU0_9APHY|nr:cytochrome P450 [Polyporus brumalis]